MSDEAKPKILVVDDERDITDLLMSVLEGAGFEVEGANNGLEALQKIKTTWYDSVLSDYKMPVMNGLELLHEIRVRKLPIPFVILTGQADKKMAVDALRLGATDFLEKPYKVPQLTQTMKSCASLGLKLRAIYESTATSQEKELRYTFENMKFKKPA